MKETLKKGFSTKKRTAATLTALFSLLIGIGMAVAGNPVAAVPMITKGAAGLSDSFSDENITAMEAEAPEADETTVTDVIETAGDIAGVLKDIF